VSHTHEVTFKPNPEQQRFITSQAKADLFSSRMGEGKSTALAWACLYHSRHNPKARWAIVRDTWENLQATTMKTFFEWFPPGIFGTFHHTKKTYTWASGVAQGEVEFLGMDDPQDASKLMSRELAGIAFDEPAPAVGSSGIDEMIFDIGLTRLRQPDMKWYAMKLAENNPDETHWTFRRFVQPGQDGFKVWQPDRPENEQNLPASYYAELRSVLQHRPDLIRRFIDGEFGFQQIGKAVTPEWADRIHLAIGLVPIPRREVIMLWDFGHNPTCIITQKTPLGQWLILDALVGSDIGVEELIVDAVRPLFLARYPKCPVRHIGDPAGNTREQSSIKQSAVRVIKKALHGNWRSGPVRTAERIEPLRAVLRMTHGGRGLVLVDRDRAAPVWHALRGGWHYHVARTGLVSGEPKKNEHSHPGDAMGYGAAVLFPLGEIRFGKKGGQVTTEPQAGWFKGGNMNSGGSALIRPSTGFIRVPDHGEPLR